jgi:periplasmic protein TonB
MDKHNLNKGLLSRGQPYFSSLVLAVLMLLSCTAKAELILNGSTVYSDLGKDQFVAALYTETAHNSPQVIQAMDAKKRMEVRILNNYSKRRWINLWMQSISINNSREDFSGSAKELIALMQTAKSAPKKGDVLEYLFSPQNGTSMRFNGTELISGLSGEVFSLLLRTWIGAIPPSTNFKEELLGNRRNSAALRLLESVEPDQERVAMAASWNLPEPVKSAPKPEPKMKSVILKPLKTAPKVAAVAKIAQPVVKPTTKSNSDSEDATTETENLATAEDTVKDIGLNKDVADNSESAISENEEADEDEDIDFNVAEALAQRDYTPLVVQKIYQNISYPRRAVSLNHEGTVRIAIKIGRSGELQHVMTTQKSKHSSLNKAALKAVVKAAPFPTLPEQVTAEFFELSIPVTFRLQ